MGEQDNVRLARALLSGDFQSLMIDAGGERRVLSALASARMAHPNATSLTIGAVGVVSNGASEQQEEYALSVIEGGMVVSDTPYYAYLPSAAVREFTARFFGSLPRGEYRQIVPVSVNGVPRAVRMLTHLTETNSVLIAFRLYNYWSTSWLDIFQSVFHDGEAGMDVGDFLAAVLAITAPRMIVLGAPSVGKTTLMAGILDRLAQIYYEIFKERFILFHAGYDYEAPPNIPVVYLQTENYRAVASTAVRANTLSMWHGELVVTDADTVNMIASALAANQRFFTTTHGNVKTAFTKFHGLLGETTESVLHRVGANTIVQIEFVARDPTSPELTRTVTGVWMWIEELEGFYRVIKWDDEHRRYAIAEWDMWRKILKNSPYLVEYTSRGEKVTVKGMAERIARCGAVYKLKRTDRLG